VNNLDPRHEWLREIVDPKSHEPSPLVECAQGSLDAIGSDVSPPASFQMSVTEARLVRLLIEDDISEWEWYGGKDGDRLRDLLRRLQEFERNH